MAAVEAVDQDVPDFGVVVRRTHILEAARVGSPALIVICAPAGFGKSVLAAQLMGQLRFDVSRWVRLYDSDLLGEEWLVRVASEVFSSRSASNESDSLLAATGSESTHAAALLRIRDGCSGSRGRSLGLVLDGAHRVDDLRPGPLSRREDLRHLQRAPGHVGIPGRDRVATGVDLQAVVIAEGGKIV